MKTSPRLLLQTSKAVCVVGLSLIGSSLALRADWDPTDPAKWIQLPDVTPNGFDVNATFNLNAPLTAAGASLGAPGRIVADDFLCNLTGPITDIHLWGSWWQGAIPTAPTQFHLSIHSDIPAVPGVSPSRPGPELWSVNMLATASRLWAPVPENFYDPLTGDITPETGVYQYNFLLDPAAAFVQQQGTIYWLDVQALVDGPFLFGWKTSDPSLSPHFNDDAAWAVTGGFGGPVLVPPDWNELRYPGGLLVNQSMDMAFVLTTTVPEPSTWAACGFVALLAGRTLWRRLRR